MRQTAGRDQAGPSGAREARISQPPPSPGTEEPQWRIVMVFVLMTIGLYLVAGPLVQLSQWQVQPESHGLMEGVAWREGRLDIPPTGPDPAVGIFRSRDTAYRDGKVYNVFPPLFTFLSYGALALQSLQNITGAAAREFYAPWYIAIVALPLPLVGFWAFRRATGRSEWAAVMTAFWILGTPLLKMLVCCRGGDVNHVNHVLSNTGLMLIAGDLLGRRRIWPTALGIIIGAWTRQLTILYLLGAVYVAWRAGAPTPDCAAPDRDNSVDAVEQAAPPSASPRRARCLTILAVAATLAVGALAVLNTLKFGGPLDSGYSLIYEGRGDIYARRAREHGLFSMHNVPRNAFYMNLNPPDVRLAGMMLQVGASGTGDGASLWMTSPLLLYGLWDVRRWWRDPARRALMLSSGLVIFGLLCYHTTGSVQHGFWRFGLDFAPIWLVVIAPYLCKGRRRWITLGCLAYSALYFCVLCGTSP